MVMFCGVLLLVALSACLPLVSSVGCSPFFFY